MPAINAAGRRLRTVPGDQGRPAMDTAPPLPVAPLHPHPQIPPHPFRPAPNHNDADCPPTHTLSRILGNCLRPYRILVFTLLSGAFKRFKMVGFRHYQVN